MVKNKKIKNTTLLMLAGLSFVVKLRETEVLIDIPTAREIII